MIGMEAIEKLIELTLWTAYLEDDQPLSALIVSEVEQGKSAMAMQFRQRNGSVVVLHDATTYGILKAYRPFLAQGKIKHFIFPEFVFPLSRQRETVNTFLAFLNGLMDEGVTGIQTFALHFKQINVL